MKAALKTPVAEGSTAAYGGGNRRDWFLGSGGKGRPSSPYAETFEGDPPETNNVLDQTRHARVSATDGQGSRDML